MSRPAASHTRARIAIGLLGPVAAFLAFLQTLGNATEALAIAEALPLLWVLAYAGRRRRIEPVGAIAVTGFAVALLLTIVFGGSSRPLELHRALFPGAVGLTCLISLGVGRPLLWNVAVRRSRVQPEATRSRLDAPGARHALVVMTAIIGITTTADAAAQVALAFTVSTSTFGVVAHIASWVIIGTGLGVGALYVRRVRAGLDQDRTNTPRPASPAPPSDPKTGAKLEAAGTPSGPRRLST